MTQPLFNIGEQAFRADAVWSPLHVPCPDCLGRKIWMVTTPNGEEFPVPCSTCSTGISEPTGTISIYEFRPAVTELTICLVRSEQTRDSHKVEYMATETGYPSGTIHNEAFLFKFPEEALHAADKLVALAAIKRDRENAERERAERKKRERKQKNTKR